MYGFSSWSSFSVLGSVQDVPLSQKDARIGQNNKEPAGDNGSLGLYAVPATCMHECTLAQGHMRWGKKCVTCVSCD